MKHCLTHLLLSVFITGLTWPNKLHLLSNILVTSLACWHFTYSVKARCGCRCRCFTCVAKFCLYFHAAGWTLHFVLGPSLADKRVRIFVNHPAEAQAGPNRHTYRELTWMNMSGIQSDCFDNFAEVVLVLSGSFNYYFTINGRWCRFQSYHLCNIRTFYQSLCQLCCYLAKSCCCCCCS